MKGTTVETAGQEEYQHPKHDRFFMRDVVTADANPALSVHRGRIEVGGRIHPHIHDGQTETFYVLSGRAICTMGEDTVVFSAGSCAVAPSGVMHGLQNDGDEPVELLALFTPALK